MTALTPKGVEHRPGYFACNSIGNVMTALTPKGVEHLVRDGRECALELVMTALTPKGVEHMPTMLSGLNPFKR